MFRKLYAFFFDKKRYAQFTVTDWMARGPRLLSTHGIDRVTIDNSDAWVSLPNGLNLRYVTEIPGAGVEPDVYRGTYEPSTTKLIVENMPQSGVFIDVGANMGWYSLHVAHHCKQSTIHAFEPGQLAYSNLTRNVERNGFEERILLHNIVASDRCGIEQFTTNQVGHALNHVLRSGSTALPSTEVESITLDHYVDQITLEQVDIIKADVEGAELLVISGASNLLEKFHPKLILEVNPEWMDRFGHTPEQLWAKLQQYGYCYEIIADDGSRNCSNDFHLDVDCGANVFFFCK